MDFTKIMRQAQNMQKNMQDIQQELNDTLVYGKAGGSLVKATMTCKGVLKNIEIDDSIINLTEKELLEDLIIAAINSAQKEAQVIRDSKMKKATGGLELPENFKLPSF